MYKIFKFAENNNYDLLNVDLKDFLKLIIQDNHYKKDNKIKFLIYDLIEFYFRKINSTFKIEIYNKYSYFIRKIYETQIYNLDEELLFTEFYDDVLNG
jgi:DNA polymerase-3 subunit delta'